MESCIECRGVMTEPASAGHADILVTACAAVPTAVPATSRIGARAVGSR